MSDNTLPLTEAAEALAERRQEYERALERQRASAEQDKTQDRTLPVKMEQLSILTELEPAAPKGHPAGFSF